MAASTPVAIDFVICTYNRAAGLDRVLSALSAQRVAAGVTWSVLVVDNGSTDSTADVVEAHRSRALLPGLRRITESVQGLTPARQRGVRETCAPWIAFVDDDNLLEPGWLDAIVQTIRMRPEAGGIGGRVILDWEKPPPNFLKGFGYCFAEQVLGVVACEVDNLVGAGMVVRRGALAECGWLERPLLADRLGKRLISGGDVEIAQRIRGAGHPLWFAPDAVLRHRIPTTRTSWQYLLRVNHGLGSSEALVSALGWPDDWRSWRHAARRRAAERFARAFRQRTGLVATLARLSYAIGFVRGVRACTALSSADRRALLGAGAMRNCI